MTKKNFNKYFEHTLLKADATEQDVRKVLLDALEYDFCGVCLDSSWLPFAYEMLKDSDVKLVTVVGFPLGTSSTEAKVAETVAALSNHAEEVDAVINVSALKDGKHAYIKKELKLLAELCHAQNAKFKIILETCLLTDKEIVKACELAKSAGVDFIKTSTGFSTGGAKAEDIRLIRQTIGEDMQIKASGGIRTLKDAEAMIAAGADRLGCSASVSIMQEKKQEKSK